MRRAEHVASMRATRIAYKNVVIKSAYKITPGSSKSRWQYNIKSNIIETGVKM
jgi:hypothetical protein